MGVLACATQWYEPAGLTTFGLVAGGLFWLLGAGQLLRDPRAFIRRVAEQRARSRLLHPFGGGDVEREFRQQWRWRWGWAAMATGWLVGSGALWIRFVSC